MTKVKRSWDLITDEKRRLVINEIINFFHNERSEEIGVIAAEAVLDFMLQTVAGDIYNKGIDDALSFIKERFGSMEQDTNALLKK